MSRYELRRTMRHPYTEIFPATHGQFAPTEFIQPAYSAACVPFRWMLRENVESNPQDGALGLAEKYRLGWVADREPEIRDKNGKEIQTEWVQERDNQLALLDTFFSAVRPHESLCFFYAKRTPLSEQSRRVIIGVGKVQAIGKATEYTYSVPKPILRSALWERNVHHSIRPGFQDGFLFPYAEILAMCNSQGLNPEQFVAFAPDECFESFSYASELLTHDNAVASLISCSAALQRISGYIEGPWQQTLAWVDTQINRLWRSRGAFPGIGSALSAFGYEWGFQHGTLLAYEIELMREHQKIENPWTLVDEVMTGPAKIDSGLAKLISGGLRNGWKALKSERRALLHLLSRCAITEEQALRIYDRTKRSEAGIDISDSEYLENPYLLFEHDRASLEPISFGAVDRGAFPDEAIRNKFPIPEPTHIDDPADARRVRALAIDVLEEAGREGHALLPESWLIQRARERNLHPPCPLGENVLEASRDFLASLVKTVETRAGEPAYQVDRFVRTRSIISREIKARRTGKLHLAQHSWSKAVDDGIGQPLPQGGRERELEEKARTEKAAALQQLFQARLSVLIGAAGTGKTTLLRMLCDLPGISERGVLLLAPTGKARVRLEQQTGLRGQGFTLAQFLTRIHRYNANTGEYFPNPKAPRSSDYKTVVVDECSMLTEEQLAALIDGLSGVDRLILVGDPRQLPPIGAGRPFVDIVNLLAPTNIESIFPKTGPGYGELTIPRRQKGEGLSDVLLAGHFSGRPVDPGADTVWDRLREGDGPELKLVEWARAEDLEKKLLEELRCGLKLANLDDELGFEESLGGSRYNDLPWAFFWHAIGDRPGAAARCADWQVLSPVRAGLIGVDSLNRRIQEQFRRKARELAEAKGWERKVPRPVGPQRLLYGDKVINVINKKRRDVWPKPEGEAYVANGDIGVIVGQYRTKSFKGLPWKIEVEFAGQHGYKYGFHPGEFGESGDNPLELAYCLTVHKTQGSEFGITFVILSNPCWLLSRELLYTALTRHRNRLVVLHQGPLVEYRRFSADEHSEIAKRMTNLFIDPMPRKVFVGTRQCFLEEGLIHRTERGDLVRSKSELVIADKLFSRGIDYAYEKPLVLPNGNVRYPDFTIADDARGVTFYWEHLGLLDDPAYRARWARKKAEYASAGILETDGGGGDHGSLIITRDNPGGGLDAAAIATTIDALLV